VEVVIARKMREVLESSAPEPAVALGLAYALDRAVQHLKNGLVRLHEAEALTKVGQAG
jgi:hypothetical protein